ncbi:MAG: MotA/TolQ/ExbB proton channel family protein [Bdellovibrionales bacterium]|nr:MotA/TolQ/ExbB proton channel family protein [Bdellovibrionales bacterium]
MFLLDIFDVIRDFLERGGNVLWLIFFTLMLLWALIIERFMYFRKEFPGDREEVVGDWMLRTDRNSWYAHKIRQAKISVLKDKLSKNIDVIKMLVALCPLMGLLGTVTGMIAVFDVMAETGTGNARLMASGISMATIPTMSGMVAALSGLYFGNLLETKAKREADKLADALPLS